MKTKPLLKSDVIKWLNSYADQFELPYEDRDEDLEDGLPYTLRTVVKILEKYAPTELNRSEFR